MTHRYLLLIGLMLSSMHALVAQEVDGEAVRSGAVLMDSATSDSLDRARRAAASPLDSLPMDSTLLALDSNINDSLSNIDTTPPRQSPLEYQVDYSSVDSMRVDLENMKVYLYGGAVATYGDIELTAGFIEISLRTNELQAAAYPDSSGDTVGEPIFTQGSQTFRAQEMRYNFNTKKGYSKYVKTEESGGYLHGETVKRDSNDVVYIKNGKYTTCEYDDPHFHIHAGKLKVIPQDKIITGPAYLTIQEIPTPLAVPFGLFPNSEDRANGLIIPTWGEARNQGFYLSRGGYYFGYKDIMDFALTADVYTRGSWALYLNSQYVKRYKFKGSYSLDFVNTQFSDPEYPDYYNAQTYNLKWRHSQDAKARPGSNFSADVNFGSSKNYRNNLQSNTNDYLRSQLNSSIRYSQNFANTPFSFSAAATGSQNTQTEIVNIRAPDVSFNMARIFPFKPKTGISKNEFLEKSGIEKIGINGALDFKNELEGKEDTLFDNMLLNMENGLRLNSTASTNIKLFKYLTLTPSTSHRFVGYRQTVNKTYDITGDSLIERRQQGLDGFYDGSASLNASTVIYGTYQYRSDLVRAMRHQVTPSASISYRPDYSEPVWGYYEDVQIDSAGNTTQYTRFEDGVFGAPSAKENGVVNLSLNNTFEFKVRDQRDSASESGDKKLKVLDAFNFSTSYNIARDSLNWAPLRIAVRSQVVKGLVFNGDATLDPYYINPTNGNRLNEWQYDRTGDIGTWTNAGFALSYTLRPKGSKKKEQEKEEELDQQNLYYTDFVDFEVPWSMSMNYNLRYTNNGQREDVDQVIDLRGDVSITRNWKVDFRTGYDIREQEITFSSFNIYRDLHCWEFSLGVVPFGSRQNYNFQINVKSAILQDLKLNRRRDFFVPER